MRRHDASYELALNPEITQFRFTSIGDNGIIEKIIEFRRIQDGRWNLCFGDVKDGDWTDNVVSNNNDSRKVLQTIANAVHLFFDEYPDKEVFIAPLDNQRRLLYNRIFQQKWQEIEPLFTVKALNLNSPILQFENYTPKKLFDYFLIRRKK